MFKKVLLTLLVALLLAGAAQAADVTLAWDANDPAPDGYRLFVRLEGQAYDYSAPAWQGTATTGTITDLVEGTTYAFVVRAYVGSVESADSNEVVYTPEAATQQIVIPRRVNGIRILFE